MQPQINQQEHESRRPPTTKPAQAPKQAQSHHAAWCCGGATQTRDKGPCISLERAPEKLDELDDAHDAEDPHDLGDAHDARAAAHPFLLPAVRQAILPRHNTGVRQG